MAPPRKPFRNRSKPPHFGTLSELFRHPCGTPDLGRVRFPCDVLHETANYADRMMNSNDLPEHARPNLSRLEAHRSQIALARRRRWPFQAIADLLLEQLGLQISGRSISDFCRRRGIVKGKGETREAPQGESGIAHRDPLSGNAPIPTQPRARKAKDAKFFFRDGPLRTRSNGLLNDE
ncbi:MAG: hypothetical protein O3C21_00240 [Verrucomicrobia bacterium]|nr:hypothetical protein [Verrucomicrobiota bacterium]